LESRKIIRNFLLYDNNHNNSISSLLGRERE